MLNLIWPIFIIISFIFAICMGNVNELNTAIFNSASDAVKMSITFLGTMCLWTGLMKIVQETTLMEKLTVIIRPLMKVLFPKMKKEDKVYKEITINIVANILGLGNAATPLGIKAMQSLQTDNTIKDTVSDDMAMLIVLNTASLQLIPTTVIAIRTSLGSIEPCSIIVPIWIATIIADIVGITITKILSKRFYQKGRRKM